MLPGQFEIVRYHNDSNALTVELGQQRNSLNGVIMIEVAGRFICQQDRRIFDDCSCQRNPLLFAPGQVGRTVSDSIRKTQLFKHSSRASATFPPWGVVEQQRRLYVL